ncbi:MAG: phosphate ABC transporter substrate-binding protein PstS, partial [Terracidiphilus sp.]
MKKTLVAVVLFVLAMSAAQAQKLTGAGATFPYPIYSKWFSEYSAAHPGVEINYQSIGSGGGIRQVTAGLVDFGASDMPMTDDALAASKIKLIHIPTVLGAVVPIFNVPGVEDIKFSGDVLADIYLGKIASWNDARIAKDNPGVKLPDQKIIVVHRSDGSGTTFIWTDYFSKVSKEW